MRALPVGIVVAVLALFGGCAVAPPPGAVVDTPTPTPSPSLSPLSEKPVVLTVGKTVDLSTTRGLAKAEVTIVQIKEQAACPSGEETPQLGQFVAVTVTGRQGDDADFDFATYDWRVVAVDGTESSARAQVVSGRCLAAADRLTKTYDVTGQVEGQVLLDAPQALSRILVVNTLATPPVTIAIELPPR